MSNKSTAANVPLVCFVSDLASILHVYNQKNYRAFARGIFFAACAGDLTGRARARVVARRCRSHGCRILSVVQLNAQHEKLSLFPANLL